MLIAVVSGVPECVRRLPWIVSACLTLILVVLLPLFFVWATRQIFLIRRTYLDALKLSQGALKVWDSYGRIWNENRAIKKQRDEIKAVFQQALGPALARKKAMEKMLEEMENQKDQSTRNNKEAEQA